MTRCYRPLRSCNTEPVGRFWQKVTDKHVCTGGQSREHPSAAAGHSLSRSTNNNCLKLMMLSNKHKKRHAASLPVSPHPAKTHLQDAKTDDEVLAVAKISIEVHCRTPSDHLSASKPLCPGGVGRQSVVRRAYTIKRVLHPYRLFMYIVDDSSSFAACTACHLVSGPYTVASLQE